MTQKIFTSLFFAAFAMTAMASTPGFLNVDVQVQENEQPTEIQLRLPLGMLKAVAPQINEALNSAEFEAEGMDLVSMWNELRAAGPNSFLTIDNEEGEINISTTETDLLVSVVAEGENLKVTMPLAVGDAFFAMNGDYNVEDMMAELRAFDGQNLVTIEGDRINGRVWID